MRLANDFDGGGFIISCCCSAADANKNEGRRWCNLWSSFGGWVSLGCSEVAPAVPAEEVVPHTVREAPRKMATASDKPEEVW